MPCLWMDWFLSLAFSDELGSPGTRFKRLDTQTRIHLVQDILSQGNSLSDIARDQPVRTRARLLVLTILASTILSPLLLSKAYASGCATTCNLEVGSNVSLTTGHVWVQGKGVAPVPLNPNYTFSFSNGTFAWVQVLNTTFISSGARYVFRQWVHNGIQWDTNPNMTTPEMLANYTAPNGAFGPFTAQFDKQYQLSLKFVDSSGQPVNPATSVTLSGPYGVTLTYTNQSFNQYSNQWLSAAVWNVADAAWEGTSGIVLGTQSIDLSQSSVTATIALRAYAATIRLVDNANNPVSGATVKVTFVNGTSTTLTSDNQGTVNLGEVPLGTYTAHITYQNQDEGSYPIDATVNPVDTVKLSIGGAGSSAPVVSAVVLLTIFGLALFLIVLAVRVRKPPPPPMIG